MREKFYQYKIVRVVDPSIGNAIEKFETIFGVRPKPALKSICGRVAVTHFANVIVCGIVEPIDRMFSSPSGFLANDAHHCIARTGIVEHQDIASLGFFVVDQRENIDIAEIGENRIVQNFCDIINSNDIAVFLFEARKHGIGFVCG